MQSNGRERDARAEVVRGRHPLAVLLVTNERDVCLVRIREGRARCNARRDRGGRPLQARALHTTAQSSPVGTSCGEALNFCANNYLGFTDHPELVEASKAALDKWGWGYSADRTTLGSHEPVAASRRRELPPIRG